MKIEFKVKPLTKIKFMKNEPTQVSMKFNPIVALKCIARHATQYITCNHKRAICGEFRCAEEVEVPEL